MGHYGKTKPKNDRDRRQRSSPTQNHRKYIHQNHRRKLSQPNERYAYEDRRRLENTK